MICPYCKKEIEPIEEITSEISIIKDAQGRTNTWTEEMKDVKGVIISKRRDEYNYHKTGEVDTIIQQVYDGKGGLISEKRIKHFKDGKQPITTENEIEKL